MATKEKAINLTAFTAFNADNNVVEIKFGSSGIKKNENGAANIIAGNVPLRGDLKAPKSGLLMLYGHKDTNEELKKRRAEALTLGSRFHFAEISIDVGPIFTGILDEETLSNARFANIRRLTADIQRDILSTFASYANEEGDDFNEDGDRLSEIGTRPDFFERLLNEDERFKKLEVFVIPVRESGVMRQIAYARKNCHVSSINQNTDRETIILPEWFGLKT